MSSDIAIVGMACRFPGAPDVGTFWRNLRAGQEAIRYFTDDELRTAGVPGDLLEHPAYVKAGRPLADADMFDADHFGITSDEAEILDPQQRQFLECAHEALEDAGYDPGRFPGLIGVYAGAGLNTYLLHSLMERYRTASGPERYRLMIGNDKDFLATRVAYKLGLRGPSTSVNTACSTSLVAVHLAVQSLLTGDCDIALAGGVHVRSPQIEGYQHHEGMILSPDGHCRAFDAKAEGTVLGSGVGLVVLKRLPEAQRDGDHVRAVIKGSAINNDGAAKSGFTAPSVAGQAAVIAEAQAVAQVEPASISYVEAHGTATPLGDPIELAALTEAFGPGLPPASCAIGSVKTNIGHLDAAAGIAGLIKTALMIEHGHLVPSLYFEAPNPELDLESSPFFVNTDTTGWVTGGRPRRAGISSFGIGGTNVHIVIEEPPARRTKPAEERDDLLLISARTPAALETAGDRLARHLREHPELTLPEVARTLAAGRRAYRHRRAVLCRGDVRAAALAIAVGDTAADGIAEDLPRIGFTYAPNAARADALYRELPKFAALADALAQSAGSHDALAALTAGGPTAAFLAQLALTRLWRDWGLVPAAGRGPMSDLVRDCTSGTATVRQAWLRAGTPETAEPRQSDDAADLWIDLLTCVGGRGALLRGLALAWAAGAEIDWEAVYADEPAGRVPLPTYPFERRRYHVGAELPSAQVRTLEPRGRLEGLDEHARAAALMGLIQEEVVRIFGAGAVLPEPDQDVFEAGLDSLILIDISAKVGAALGVDVPASAFVANPTIRGFVNHLSSRLGTTVPD